MVFDIENCLSPHILTTDDINKNLLDLRPLNTISFTSIDTDKSMEDATFQIHPELPPHDLQLKVGASVTMLRNLGPPTMIIKYLNFKILIATVFNGPAAGTYVHIYPPHLTMIKQHFYVRYRYPSKTTHPLRVAAEFYIPMSRVQPGIQLV